MRTSTCALLHPFEVAGTVVLAHKGGGRHAEAGDGQDVEAVDLHVGGKARHGGGTVAVDAGLDQHVREGDDHVLDAGGQADADDAGGHPLVGTDGGMIGMLNFVANSKSRSSCAGTHIIAPVP